MRSEIKYVYRINIININIICIECNNRGCVQQQQLHTIHEFHRAYRQDIRYRKDRKDADRLPSDRHMEHYVSDYLRGGPRQPIARFLRRGGNHQIARMG